MLMSSDSEPAISNLTQDGASGGSEVAKVKCIRSKRRRCRSQKAKASWEVEGTAVGFSPTEPRLSESIL